MRGRLPRRAGAGNSPPRQNPPRFTAATADTQPHRSMITVARSIDGTQAAYEESRHGHAAPHWAELYFHSAYDASVAVNVLVTDPISNKVSRVTG